MSETKHCAECAAPLPVYWPKGLCAQCALDGALALSLAGSQIVQPEAPTPPNRHQPPPSSGDTSPLGSFGDYDLLDEIAHGGMGIVYKARQRKLGRIVAVKMILAGPRAGKEFVQRFRTESAAAAILQHPNIVAVHDVGVHEGRHYFSMDYVEGQNLAQLVGQQPLPPAKAARYIELIAAAIHYAHERGILHRDLKPSNVLVDASDQPRVTDFGLAKRFGVPPAGGPGPTEAATPPWDITITGQLLGSPNFMPPEQAGGKHGKVGPPSDVYALGGILYFLVTARAPFQADSLEQIITLVVNVEPVSPRLLNPSIPKDLETIMLKCLEKEPSRRYQTAQELAEELGRVLRQEPILSRPVSASEKVWRWCRRKPALASAVGLVVASLLAGMAGTSWQWRRAEHQSANAKHLLYVANLNLVQAAWEQNHISRAEQILEETATEPVRGFEWYYWQRQLHLDELILRGHTEPVLAVAWSPVGSRIVTGSADHTAKVWNSSTGEALLSLRGHTDIVRAVAWSADGHWIVTGSFDRTARVWNATNAVPGIELVGHQGAIMAVAFSPDARRIVTGSRDQTAIVWDVATGKSLFTLKDHKGVIWSVAYSSDSQRIATASWDYTAMVWNASNGEREVTFTGHHDPVLAVAFSPDGRRIVSGGLDRTARIWDAANGKELSVLKGHTAPLFSVAFSRDGERIATAGDDQTARVWDSNERNDLIAVKRHRSAISSVDFSADGQRIATGGGSMNFSPDGVDQLHAGGGDRTVRIWQISSEAEALTLRGHSNGVYCAAFSLDEQRIVTSSSDQTAKIWEAATGRVLTTLTGHKHLVRAAAFSPDAQRIVTASADGTCKVWDATTGEALLTFRGHKGWVMSVAFSPDGRRIASASQDGMAKVWDTTTGEEQLKIDVGGWVWSVAFSPDGGRLLTGNEDRDLTAKVWNAATGKELLALKGHRAWVMFAAFSSDARRIVTASADGTCRVWDAATGRCLVSLHGHSDRVVYARFSPDGQRIVSGSIDQTARVWDAGSGKELLTLKGHTGWVTSVTFSRDGRRILTASLDRTAKVWEAASPAQIAQWREEEENAEAERHRERVALEKSTRATRAELPGAIKRWLMLLPIGFEGRSGAQALDLEQLARESQLRPRNGDKVRVSSSDLVWREVQSEDYRFDFDEVAGRSSEFSVAYAVCYLESETARTNLIMKVGSDDQSKVFLNEREVYRITDPRMWEPDRDTVRGIELKAGLNVLVFKVVNERLGWGGSIRLTDSAGDTVKGLRVTLTPP